MDFQTTMTIIARVCPDMLLRDANALALALSAHGDVFTHAGRVALVRNTPSVMAYLPDSRIAAIKELRAVTADRFGYTLSLIDAKNAVDEVSPFYRD